MNFRIGQRVRYVRRHPEGHEGLPIGSVGTITRVGHLGIDRFNQISRADYQATFDDGLRAAVEGWQLEPLYDGNQVVSWDAIREMGLCVEREHRPVRTVGWLREGERA